MKKIKSKILKIIRESFLRKRILDFLIFLHNFSYNWIKVFVNNGKIHPKHDIVKYEKFFLNNIDSGSKILDIGCANGFLAGKISGKAGEIYAIDISLKNIESAKKQNAKDNIKYVVGDATTYDFEGKFDAIILSNVLEHIDNRIDFLNKLHRLSDKLLIRVPMVDRDWLTVFKKENGYKYMLDDEHYIEYTVDSLKKELKNSGWKLENYSIQFGEMYCNAIKL